MRITGGTLCGRIVEVPKGIIRPAMDRMRESIFGILGDLNGKSFLDLFSGSLIIALEAASRGASFIEAVESDAGKRNTIIKNASISPLKINCRFMAVELYVQRSKKNFDYIFCDPPFPYQFKGQLIAGIAKSHLMHEGSTLLLHRPREEKITNILQNLSLQDHREYGRSVVDFYKKNKEE